MSKNTTTMSANTRKILGLDVPKVKHVVRRAVMTFSNHLDDSLPKIPRGIAFDGATGFMC